MTLNTVPCGLVATVFSFLAVYLGTLAGEEAFWSNHQPQTPALVQPQSDDSDMILAKRPFLSWPNVRFF
jgi:hypothetical protein